MIVAGEARASSLRAVADALGGAQVTVTHGDLLNASWILELFLYVLCFIFFIMSLFCLLKMEELIFILLVSVTYELKYTFIREETQQVWL